MLVKSAPGVLGVKTTVVVFEETVVVEADVGKEVAVTVVKESVEEFTEGVGAVEVSGGAGVVPLVIGFVDMRGKVGGAVVEFIETMLTPRVPCKHASNR